MYSKFKLFLLFFVIFSGLVVAGYFVYARFKTESTAEFETTYEIPTKSPTSPTEPVKPVITSKTLKTSYHVFQTFNNCGPASLSMALSYYNINVSQKELGDALRPYQNQQGDNDDKAVTLEELADKSKDYGLIPYHRPNGNMDLIEEFIRNDIPVITHTWLHENEDIGHFRVVKGFSKQTQEIIQDDSYEGKNLVFSYDKFNRLWEAFNYEYLVLVTPDKKEIAEKILGLNVVEKYAWEQAKKLSQEQIVQNQNNYYAGFNLSVAEFYLGNYQASVNEFEKVQNKLPKRMLWYQTEPILAYQKLKQYDKVFEITQNILDNGNRAFSELYIIRGEIYKEQGNESAAKQEFEKAKLYNKHIFILEI